jgi:hypothetical protein
MAALIVIYILSIIAIAVVIIYCAGSVSINIYRRHILLEPRLINFEILTERSVSNANFLHKLSLFEQKFINLGIVKGKTYAEIVDAIQQEHSGLTEEVLCTTGQIAFVRCWNYIIESSFDDDFIYEIELLFDDKEICLGVISEITRKEHCYI